MKIFISYSRVDLVFTKRFVERLQTMFPYDSVWYDQKIHGGDIWWEEILNQISACDIFIYLLSNESVTSPYCKAEFTEARRLQKLTITVQVRDRTKLTDELNDIQYVDMKAGVEDATAVAALAGAINYRLDRLPKRSPKPLWQPRTPRPKGAEEKPVALREDVDTPILSIASLQGTRPWWMTDTVLAAVIGGIFVVLAALIGIAPTIFRGNTTPTLVSMITASATFTATLPPTFTVTLSPTAITPTPKPTLTLVQPTKTPVLPTQPQPILQHIMQTQTAFALSSQVPSPIFALERSPDTIAICASSTADLSKLEIGIGRNESYSFSKLFPDVPTAPLLQCFCIQGTASLFLAPSVCTPRNTKQLSNIGDWRNAAVTLRLSGGLIGTCQPRADLREPYICSLD